MSHMERVTAMAAEIKGLVQECCPNYPVDWSYIRQIIAKHITELFVGHCETCASGEMQQLRQENERLKAELDECSQTVGELHDAVQSARCDVQMLLAENKRLHGMITDRPEF